MCECVVGRYRCVGVLQDDVGVLENVDVWVCCGTM